MIWRMAWRNLWRSRGRTLILTSVIAMTYSFTLVGLSIGDDSHQRMLDEAVQLAGGDVLVHGFEYWNTRGSDIVIENAAAIEEQVRAVSGVATVLPRVIVSGLVSTSLASRPVLLQGVRPQEEGGWRTVAEDLRAGTFLEDERSDPLVLGFRLADRLGAELGDRIVLTASAPDGELTRALFHLTGILDMGSREMDEVLGFTTVEAAQRAVRMTGELTQIGVLLETGTEAETVAASIVESLGPATARPIEVLTWRQAVPEMVGFIELDDAFGYIYLVVIFTVVLFAITNTFLMAVMERVREFGLLSALGLRGRRIGRLILFETALLTALAMAVGFAIGFSGHLAADHWGINLAGWGIEDLEVSGVNIADMVIHSTITPAKWVAASVLVALASMASALYPAWRAAQLAPAEAMRFYE